MGAKSCTCINKWEKTNQYEINSCARESSVFSPRRINFRAQPSELLKTAGFPHIHAIRNQQLIENLDNDITWDEILESSSGQSICSSVHIIGEDLNETRENQDMKPIEEDTENFSCNAVVKKKESPVKSSHHQSHPDQCVEISGSTKTCQQSCLDSDSKNSKELKWCKDSRGEGDILQLPELNITDAKSGLSICCTRTSTTIPEYDGIHLDLSEQDTSSPGGKSSYQENQTFSEAGFKEVASLINNPGLNSFLEKYSEILGRSKIDAPFLFSTSDVELKRMWLLEHHARAILAAVHHTLQNRFTSREHQIPAQLFKFTNCDNYSDNTKFYPAEHMKQLSELRVTCEKQKERIMDLEAAVANHKIEKENLTKNCEDLDLRNKASSDKTSQLLANCKLQTERAEKLQKDLDQCVAEVDRLETKLESIRSQKNKVWEELQVENQSSTEQKKMLLNVTRKYTEEVGRLQRLLDSMNPEHSLQSVNSDLIYSVAFDDLPSERGQLFSNSLSLLEELVIPEAQNTATDEKWRNSQDNIAKILQNMPSICELDTAMCNLEKGKTIEGKSAIQNKTNSIKDITKERRDTRYLPEGFPRDSLVTVGDVSFTGLNQAGDNSHSFTQSETTQEEGAISPTFEQGEHCSFSARESKDQKAPFSMFTRQLTPEDLSSLIFFGEETSQTHSPKLTASTDMTDLKPLLENSPRGSEDFTEDDHTNWEDRPTLTTESDVSSTKQLYEYFGCAGELVSNVNLVECVGELLSNVVTTEGFLSWDSFSVTLSKHCCYNNRKELLRPVFDACKISHEEMISFDVFKEKLKTDVSDPFLLFRNNFFSEKPLGTMKAAERQMSDANQEAIPCGELGDGGVLRNLSIKSTTLQPTSIGLDNKEVHTNYRNLRTVHVSHSKNIIADALSTDLKHDGNQS